MKDGSVLISDGKILDVTNSDLAVIGAKVVDAKGEPIPMISCPKCGWVPMPEDQLPLVLPQVESYEPTDDGESPISKMTDWVNTTCPCCGGPFPGADSRRICAPKPAKISVNPA